MTELTRDPYVDFYGTLGMLSKNQVILEDGSIKRNKNKIVCFDLESVKNNFNKYENINIAYIQDKKGFINNSQSIGINCKFSYKSTEITSGPFTEENLFTYPGKSNKEFRETLNSLDKKVIVTKEPRNLKKDVESVVNQWNETQGTRYGWQLHSGYDKSFFFSQYYEKEKQNLQTLFFYNLEGLCIGYSVISRIPSGLENQHNFIIRKYRTDQLRNLCLYIDIKSFQEFYISRDLDCLLNDTENESENLKSREFYINWGASSGKVLEYKMNKFERWFHKKYDVWFGKVIK